MVLMNLTPGRDDLQSLWVELGVLCTTAMIRTSYEAINIPASINR